MNIINQALKTNVPSHYTNFLISSLDNLKRYVFNLVLKMSTFDAVLTDVGSLLNSLGPTTLKLRCPYLLLTRGTISCSV